MTQLSAQEGSITAPQPSTVSQPYWDAVQRHELVFQRCRECQSATHTPSLLCANCMSRNLEWEKSCGVGTIYSWTVVHRPVTPSFHVPYAPIIVEITEPDGVKWFILSALIDCDDSDLAVGLNVEVVFTAASDGLILPYFRPALPMS